MCDEYTEADNEAAWTAGRLSRRDFAVMAGGAGLAMMLPAVANARPVAGRMVTIATPDGTADAYFVAPDSGTHPAVLMWPDIGGLRPAFQAMADRLAQSGYAVLCVNQFYRSAKSPVLAEGETFQQPDIRAKLFGYAGLLTPAAVAADAAAYVAFIDAQPQVDGKRGVATTGYCMGGPLAFRTAAAAPARVRAVGTFHGGGLATDKPDSPHLLVASTKAAYLIAIAENDDARSPGDKDVLKKTFADTGHDAELEVYAGTMHGWCPPDSRVYNQEQAERAWSRMLALFEKNL